MAARFTNFLGVFKVLGEHHAQNCYLRNKKIIIVILSTMAVHVINIQNDAGSSPTNVNIVKN